jgi:hypothetical protein
MDNTLLNMLHTVIIIKRKIIKKASCVDAFLLYRLVINS